MGHPTRIVDNFLSLELEKCPGKECDVKPCKGHIKAKILPPKWLLYPSGKFPLCYKCSTLHLNDTCECDEMEHCLMQMWTTPEVELAINHGYIMVEIYEVLHWEKSDMIDMETKKGGILNNYINTFLTIKAEASRYPDNVKTD